MRVTGAIAIVFLIATLVAACGGGSTSTGPAKDEAAGLEEEEEGFVEEGEPGPRHVQEGELVAGEEGWVRTVNLGSVWPSWAITEAGSSPVAIRIEAKVRARPRIMGDGPVRSGRATKSSTSTHRGRSRPVPRRNSQRLRGIGDSVGRHPKGCCPRSTVSWRGRRSSTSSHIASSWVRA
jgi:hypothetical protein